MEIDFRSLGGKLRKLSSEEVKYVYGKSKSLERIHKQLLRIAPKKANKVIIFLKDLFKTIENIFKVMKPDSYQVWTIGNRSVGGIEIPNNDIIKEFVISEGGILVAKVAREIINKRMATRNSNSALMNTEDILIFRKIGKK